MISISGIKFQKELETLPYLNKIAASVLIGKKERNLDKKIEQLLAKKYLLSLKKGLYVTSVFTEKVDISLYQEYIANVLRYPSYVSLEYALFKYGLIPEGVFNITSITLKSSRVFANFLNTFIYKNIKQDLFCGYITEDFLDKKINMATPAKALFDFFYLKKLVNLEKEIKEDLRINWENFSADDQKEFRKYVKKVNSPKMKKILKIIEENL